MAYTEITGHFIGGKSDVSGSEKLERLDPATGEQMGYVTLADEQTVNAAVDASKIAYEDWRVVEPAKRAAILRRFCELVTAQADELCLLVTREHGKTLLDAQGELQRGIENIEYATGIAEHLKGEYTKAVGPDIDSWSQMSPLGVVVGITPFNFPVMVPMWMFPLAVACGNTFILKPSESGTFLRSGTPRWGFQRCSRRSRDCRMVIESSGHQGGEFCWFDAGCTIHIQSFRRQWQASSSPWRRKKSCGCAS